MMKRRTLALMVAMLFLLPSLLFAGCSRASADLPAKTDAFYYCDEANVLETATENRIKTLNDALFALTGAQIVVVTTETTGKADIATYATDLFDAWGIGSAERQNGILLLLAIDDDNYYALPGSGLEDTLTKELLRSLLNEYLEPDFAKKQYSTGAVLWVEGLAALLEGYYGVDLAAWNGVPGEFTPLSESSKNTAISPTAAILIGVAALVIILILILIFGSGRGRRRRRRRIRSVSSRPVYRQGYYPNTRPTVRPPKGQNGNGRKY